MSDKLSKTIQRINQMEYLYEIVSQVILKNPECYHKNTIIQAMIDKLIDYYDHEWLEDYACDERNELPKDLKRGILSQDGLYDLLSLINKKS